jgi:predicted phage terminase large subunit-like protein
MQHRLDGEGVTNMSVFVDSLEAQLTFGRAKWTTPGQMAADLDPKTVQTPALELIDQELVRLADTPDGRLIIVMPPQEGKSQRVTRRFPTWMLTERPDTRIAIASFEHSTARRWGRAIRDDIRGNGSKLNLRIRDDLSAQSEWQLAGYEGGVYAVGIGGALTGRPVDLLVIDDPIKDRKQADSETYRAAVWDWWTDVASTRLAPGAPVVLILTRWHDDDLAGRLLAAEDGDQWRVVRIPAQADHDPDAGETDPLDREVGEFLDSARGRTLEQWARIKVRSGSRTWNALYQGRPSSAEGDMFKRADWQFYDTPLWVERPDGTRFVTAYDDMLSSWDLTFKNTEGSDMVVGQVWMRRGADAYLLDQVRGRMDFPQTQWAFRTMAARWPQAVLKLVEDKANGPAIIASLRHTVPGIVPEEPQGSKVARAAAVSPLVESHNVFLPSPELLADGDERPYAWVGEFVEEHAGFPTAAHDDQVDGTSQALNRLILQPLITGGDVVEVEEYDVVDSRGFYASPI